MGELKRTTRDKDPRELVVVGNDNWLEEIQDVDDSTESLKEHIIIPRLKIVSGSSKAELKDEFGVGSFILEPSLELLAKKGEHITVIPLFQYMSYYGSCDYKDQSGTRDYEYSLDKNSEVGQKALQYVTEKYTVTVKGEQVTFDFKYQQCFNFVCLRVDSDGEILFDEPFTIPMKGGEFTYGKKFASAAVLRKVESNGKKLKLPLWAQFWDFSVETHQKDQYDWEGFRIRPNGNIDLADTELAQKCFQSYSTLKEVYDAKRLFTAGEGVQDDDHPREVQDESVTEEEASEI